MSGISKNASEAAFQDKFVKELQKYKWDAPDFLDGNKQKVTVQTLINHWSEQLNRINADQLEGVPLTDNEFKQVMAKVSQTEIVLKQVNYLRWKHQKVRLMVLCEISKQM